MIELNLRALRLNAPADRYEITLVNDTNIGSLIPDLPEGYFRLPDYGSRSDLIPAALLSHYGGFYMDGDVLIAKDLSFFTDKLEDYDMVSYGGGKKRCEETGLFSSNIMAARKGNELNTKWWDSVKEQMKTRCFDQEGKAQRCDVPWAALGERTAHPLLQEIVQREGSKYRVYCFAESPDFSGFTPDPQGKVLWRELIAAEEPCREKHTGATLPSGRVVQFSTVRQEAGSCPCWEVNKDVMCADFKVVKGTMFPKHGYNLLNRGAYHMFNSIVGDIPKRFSQEEVIDGPWIMSKIYRKVFGISEKSSL